MRKSVMMAMATVLLAGAPMLAISAYADGSSSASTAPTQDLVTPQGMDAQQPGGHGANADGVLRSGADPNNPSDYAFLPPGKLPPTPGIRNNQPQPPDSTLTDLAIGKSYTIGTEWSDTLFHKIESHFANHGQLTDGLMASLSFSDPGWVGFLRQYGRSVTVDLGSVQNVRRVSLDMLQNLGAGIDFLDSMTYYASTDGQNWYTLGSAWSKQGGGDYTPQTQPYYVDTNVNARYIRAQFTDKVFSFADEFSVFGVTQPSLGAKPLVGNGQDVTQVMGNDYLADQNAPGLPLGPSGEPGVNPPPGQGAPNPSGYLSSTESATGGIKNLQLVYTGAPYVGPIGTWTQTDFLPMIAKQDKNGNPNGWLFDGTLFGPYGSPNSVTSWNAWLADLFTQNIELSALNQAVGTVKQELNDPNYKEKVVITIPGLVSSPSEFGAIDSSGQNLDMNPSDVGDATASANKEKAILWFMQNFLDDWNNAHFNNLTLEGFYWQPEAVNTTSPTDAELIQATADAVHRNHLLFYWIPYYGAPGLSNWKQLGFDDVMIQPNVSFNWGIDAKERLKSTADEAQFYHTGLEIEAHWDVTSADVNSATIAQNKYYDYFTAGNVYGFMSNVEKSYYLGSKTLLTAYQSIDPFYHAVYDNTVTFVNGQWTGDTFN